MPHRIRAESLLQLLGSHRFPHFIDVRREEVAREAGFRAAGSIWRHHMRAAFCLPSLTRDRQIVVYCAHGHNVSEIAAAELGALGASVAILDGGFDAWQEAGGPCVRIKAPGVDLMGRATSWVTRERPKIDRIACPWLLKRFIDPASNIRFVAAQWVVDVAQEIGAVPFDVVGAHYSHRGDGCSFDTMLDEFGLNDPALRHLADIVRGADTARFDIAPQAAGLAAMSFGLSAIEPDDLEQVERGMLIYDALYGWCHHAKDETHSWQANA
jgi:rhodanese-related sulfurtransferase